jgi:predicted CoA-substrate-specific enzyme activase
MKKAGETEKYYVGVDIGSVSVNCVVIDTGGRLVSEYPYRRHFGRIREVLYALVADLYRRFDRDRIRAVAFTGNQGQHFAEKYGAFYEFETIAQVLGALFVRPDARTVISMGGQETALFQIAHGAGGWELEHFNTNGPCASGTGSFIDQQAMRLATAIYDLNFEISQDQIDSILDDFIRLGLESERPADVACRCTVFTKSDMIHLQNKGERLEDIISGLHSGNARNYMSTIVSNRRLASPALFVGGLSLNRLQVRAFKQYFPELIVPPHSTSIGALGVALQAREQQVRYRIGLEEIGRATTSGSAEFPAAPRLALHKTLIPEDNRVRRRLSSKKFPAYLGIDIGSTTTKYALIDTDRNIIHKSYIHTQGKPVDVTKRLLQGIRDEVGHRIDIAGTATTGSGRNVVGEFLNVDLILDEITAHARGAVAIDPEVDTVFEIGGQDAKYIAIANTHPLDFDMNKVCAAGTGSFLHELANKYGINIVNEFQDLALGSERPIRLAERCTVFMESDLLSYDRKGVPIEDLMAGLCYAVVHNYLNRVVGKRKIGRRVMFLGGPSLNKAVVAAFENVLGRPLLVPKHREVLGAYGAAIAVQERMSLDVGNPVSTFRGLDSAIQDPLQHTEKVCNADPNCHNQCKLKIYDFGGRRSIWGGECGRYEVVGSRVKKSENLFKRRDNVWQRFMSGLYEELRQDALIEVDGRLTVGMQRSLYTLQTSVLWANFFDQLGLRLVLTPPTNSAISVSGIEEMTAEACYPVKVSHGHVRLLAGRTKYLFLPTLVDMPTPEASETGFYCPLVQSNAFMVRSALGLNDVEVIEAALHLKQDTATLGLSLAAQLADKLKVRRTKIREALHYAVRVQQNFVEELYEVGAEVLDNHPQDEPLVIVTGRPYNLYDERLNLGLGRNLAKIGVKALPMDLVDVRSMDLSDFPSMYWGTGAGILRTAKFIQGIQHFYGLHITNFGCGADSFLEHFYKFIMDDKPYLILELDEHSGVAGVMTRLEAFKNVIDNSMKNGATISHALGA